MEETNRVKEPRNSLTYKDAGVDIERGDRLIERIKPLAAATMRPEVLAGLGGFGAMVEIPMDRYRRPVLVSGADGVGTKLRLAIDAGQHDYVGIDLVAMCANDVLAQGAEPLYFLDYYATGQLDEDVAYAVVKGIAQGCKQAGCALIGGETAEMPGMYANKDYDLAGFCVGIVERDNIIDGSAVKAGQALIGLASSGPHSNGFSLIRKVLEVHGMPLDTVIDRTPSSMPAATANSARDRTLVECLLEPTRIYARSVLGAMHGGGIVGVAHITGGGLTENIPRMLPKGLNAHVDLGAWPQLAVFTWLQRAAGIDDAEMRRTFNCGVGLVLCVDADRVTAVCETLRDMGERVFEMGTVEAAEHPESAPRVIYGSR